MSDIRRDGVLSDGTVWRVRVPADWNGCLVNDFDFHVIFIASLTILGLTLIFCLLF